MKSTLSIILLEDNDHDAELLEQLLHSEGFNFTLKICATESSFSSALSDSVPDLIISDFSLPSYTGKQALTLAKAMHPRTPFIFFSGTIGEETAVEALKEGATDYVLKQKPQRLVSAVRRALFEREEQGRNAEAEEQIRDQAQLLDLATDAIIVLDLDDRIQFLNQGAELLYGYSRSELIGKKSTDFMHPALLKQFEEAKRATLRDGHWEGEMEHNTKELKPVLVMSRLTLVKPRPNLEQRILAIHTDITEKRQLEKQFLRAQRLESIGTLASGIAHDLNNILAPICLSTELLRAGTIAEADAPLLDIIDQSARRGAEIVKQILTFVRGGEGKRTDFSLERIVKEIAETARETFPRKIHTEYRLDEGLWLINGDAGQMHQVLMNLCVNARDAMPEGGTLTVSAQNLESDAGVPHVLVEVTDTGTGIAPEVLDKMFDPFFTTKEIGEGTGLGLSTVMGIVKSHGGRIDVQSTVGSGTCFQILLPARVAPVASDRSNLIEIPRGNGELILLVDDEPELRKITAQTLVQHGYTVLTAADGSEGILNFTERIQDIRVVVTDLMMPGVDGASFAKSVRKLKSDARIIASTGSELLEIPEAEVLLRKPYEADALLRAVFQALTR